jgi:hypothetical protein
VTHTIYEIDLAGNLFGPDWTPVHDIIHAFPNVKTLSFASNFIYDFTPCRIVTTAAAAPIPTIYPHRALQHLNLNCTKIQHLSTIHQIGQSFPQLQELIIANNQCDSYCSTDYKNNVTNTTTNATKSLLLNHVLQIATTLATLFPTLVLLDCSNCHLNFWSTRQKLQQHDDIFSVDNSIDTNNIDPDDTLENYNLFLLLWSKLPKLQILSWDDNRNFTKFVCPYAIQTKQHNDDHKQTIYFPSLQQFHCVHTGITDWMDIVPVWDEFIPSLQTIRFKHCPLLYGMSVAQIRHQLIGYCPSLNMINATPITEQERREVAKQVISMLPNNRVSSNPEEASQQNQLIRHRKYDYWVAQYPDIASSMLEQRPRENSPISTLGIASLHQLPIYTTNFAIVNVTFRSMASSSCTKEPFTRRLPTQMTIRKVKALCARQFDTEIDDQILYVCSPNDNSIPQIMDCNDHTLHYYGVPDGAEILMHEIIENNARGTGSAKRTDGEIQGMGYDVADDRHRQKMELDHRVDQLEKEMNDFKLRQMRIVKK